MAGHTSSSRQIRAQHSFPHTGHGVQFPTNTTPPQGAEALEEPGPVKGMGHVVGARGVAPREEEDHLALDAADEGKHGGVVVRMGDGGRGKTRGCSR